MNNMNERMNDDDDDEKKRFKLPADRSEITDFSLFTGRVSINCACLMFMCVCVCVLYICMCFVHNDENIFGKKECVVFFLVSFFLFFVWFILLLLLLIPFFSHSLASNIVYFIEIRDFTIFNLIIKLMNLFVTDKFNQTEITSI